MRLIRQKGRRLSKIVGRPGEPHHANPFNLGKPHLLTSSVVVSGQPGHTPLSKARPDGAFEPLSELQSELSCFAFTHCYVRSVHFTESPTDGKRSSTLILSTAPLAADIAMASTMIFRLSGAGTRRRVLRIRQAAIIQSKRSLSSFLVTPKELAEALKKSPPSAINPEPRVIPLCAAWFLPNDERKGIQVFREKRIPKARFFDLDRVKDKHSPYPHMLPSPKEFAAAMSELGIRKEDTVVVYDTQELGIFSAPRVGWTLKVFGHPQTHVLNNFKLWVEQGYPTESGELFSVECNPYLIPKMDGSKVASYEEVKEAALDYNKEGAEGVQILDARPPGRFIGKEPEPREGLSSGHMPGSINVPFSAVLDPQTKAFLPKEQLRRVFEEKGIDPARPMISSCGTGVTAVVLDTALEEAGYGSPERCKVYDGSWTWVPLPAHGIPLLTKR